MKLLIGLILTLTLSAQTLSISGGAVYQTALSNGIQYISPSSGQAILNQKAGLNWKNIILEAAGIGSIAAVTSGLSGLVAISKPVLAGLAVGHVVYDQFGQPLLQTAAPNPGAISPVLQVNSTLSPTLTSCIENSIFASAVEGQAVKKMKKGMLLRNYNNSVGGLSVTFAPQGVQVLKNAAGSTIKQFIVVDVLVCIPTPVASVLR